MRSLKQGNRHCMFLRKMECDEGSARHFKAENMPLHEAAREKEG